MQKGIFLTIYGINNIGKTTHAKLLVKRLQAAGKKAVYLKYPVYESAPTGPFLNKILRSGARQKISEEELQLWFVLNRAQFEPQLKKWLSEGTIVVAEDYIGTGIAWGTAKGADTAWLANMNKFLVQEDYALFLDGKRTVQAAEKNHLHETNQAILSQCEKVLRDLAKKQHWHRIEVERRTQDTAQKIWHFVESLVF